jgi:hypothetical protein
MNDERRLLLERLFDGEARAQDHLSEGDDPQARAYLRQLELLRALARRHDPDAEAPARRSGAAVDRPRRRALTVSLAVAASLMITALGMRFGMRTKPATIPPPAGPSRSGLIAATNQARVSRPSLEVELFRWANAISPRREDAVAGVLARVASPRGRSPAREVLVLELANATPGSSAKLPRSIGSHTAATATTIRRSAANHRHRHPFPPKV